MPVVSIFPKFSTEYSTVVISPGWISIFDSMGLKFHDKFGWTLVSKFIVIGFNLIAAS